MTNPVWSTTPREQGIALLLAVILSACFTLFLFWDRFAEFFRFMGVL